MTLWVRPSPQPLTDSPGMLHGIKDGWKWSEKLFWLKIFGKDEQVTAGIDIVRYDIYTVIDLLARFLRHWSPRCLLINGWQLIWVQSVVLRLASTAVQHQSPQLQPKQPSLHWCHFVAGLLAIFALIIRPFQGRVHCRLFCQMHCSILDAMSDGNVSQWCVTGCHRWSGRINFSFCASSGIWSLLWQDMFLHSQGLVFLGAKMEGSKDYICLSCND